MDSKEPMELMYKVKRWIKPARTEVCLLWLPIMWITTMWQTRKKKKIALIVDINRLDMSS